MEETATYARLKERGGPVPVSTKIYQGACAWPLTRERHWEIRRGIDARREGERVGVRSLSSKQINQ